MKIFDKSLLIEGDKYYFDNNENINKIKSERRLTSPSQIKLNTSDLGGDIINKIINDKHLYSCVFEYFNSDSCPMSISVIKDDKIYNYYLYKINLLETLDEYIKNNKINITSEGLNNIKELSNSISMDRLKEELNNKTFTLKINNKYVNCPYNIIFNFLEMDNNYFYSFFEKEGDYNGLSKSIFIYMIKEFYKQYNEGYLFNNNIKQRLKYIKNQTNIETIVFDKKFTSEPDNSIYRKINLDEEFKNEIINSIPSNLNKLEKVLYVYVKLCQELKFDLESYASGKEETIISKHKDLNRLKNVNKKENNIVCWEFNAIFARFLNELNIDFEIRQEGENYGDTHAWLRINIDNILLSIDPVHKMFWEFDFLQAKVNLPLKGIKLYNKNNNTINLYNNSLNKIYSLLYTKEINNNYDYILNNNSLSIFDKLNMMVEFAEKTNLSEMESVGYLLNMYKDLKEKEKNVTIEKRMIETHFNNEYKLSVLFIITNKNKDKEEFTYCVYTPNEPFRRYDNDSIEYFFEHGVFSPQNKDKDMFIPGINYIYKKQIDLNIGRIR